uniref:Uncharacterized protein n=1 Tax=Zosterops lateralis melanops TaxID=1220523 RepID=A0A8D2QU10_ZOSLA
MVLPSKAALGCRLSQSKSTDLYSDPKSVFPFLKPLFYLIFWKLCSFKKDRSSVRKLQSVYTKQKSVFQTKSNRKLCKDPQQKTKLQSQIMNLEIAALLDISSPSCPFLQIPGLCKLGTYKT